MILTREQYNNIMSVIDYLLQKALIQLSSEKLKKTLKSREIIECIAALDDLNRTVNLLRERESDWVRVYPDSEPPEIFGDFSSSINDLVSYRESLTTSIELMMREKNPTLSTLVGELLGARLIALAGGEGASLSFAVQYHSDPWG